MARRRKPFSSRFLSQAWLETEINDEGEVMFDLQPVHCPTCHHPLDLGGLDVIDVHRCGYCRKRTHFLWSDRRGLPVQDMRGLSADWQEEKWDDLWRNFDSDDEADFDDFAPECHNGCEDPVFGGPADQLCLHGRWVCSVCGEADDGDFDALDDRTE